MKISEKLSIIAACSSCSLLFANADLFRNAADNGEADAQFYLAVCYANGDGVKKDLAQTVKWLQKSANQGNVNAQLYLGMCYEFGEGVKKSEIDAFNWYTAAAKADNANAQYLLASCYDYGKGIKKNPAIAIEWYTKAANNGHVSAQWALAWHFFNAIGTQKDEAQAIEWYTKAANNGHKAAYVDLAVCYESIKDYANAAKWYTKAVEKFNNPFAAYKIGFYHEKGLSVKADEKKAKELYRKASNLGSAEAQTVLAELLLKEDKEDKANAKKDNKNNTNNTNNTNKAADAVELLKKAAANNYGKALRLLAGCYEKGIGVSKNATEAESLYKKAASVGDLEAFLYLESKGIKF